MRKPACVALERVRFSGISRIPRYRIVDSIRRFASFDSASPSPLVSALAVAWQFTGMNPEELEGRLTSTYERILTTTVDNIEHIESTTVNGQAIVRIFLQPGASLDTANAQVTAISQTVLRQLPPGTLPPINGDDPVSS